MRVVCLAISKWDYSDQLWEANWKLLLTASGNKIECAQTQTFCSDDDINLFLHAKISFTVCCVIPWEITAAAGHALFEVYECKEKSPLRINWTLEWKVKNHWLQHHSDARRHQTERSTWARKVDLRKKIAVRSAAEDLERQDSLGAERTRLLSVIEP